MEYQPLSKEPYQHQKYPSTRYHRDGSVVEVKDPEHEAQVAPAEEGWTDTPKDFAPQKPKRSR